MLIARRASLLPLALLLASSACSDEATPGAPASSTSQAAPQAAPEPARPVASAKAAGGPPKHILLLTIDTLRADRLGCYGHPGPVSPNIDALAARGVRFANAAAPRSATWPTLTSVLTAKYPLTHGVRDNATQPAIEEKMLSHRLRNEGYATGAFLANFGQGIQPVGRRGFRTRLDTKGDDGQEQWDRRAAMAAMEWIRRHKDERCFTWLHLINPHRPYDPPPGTEALVPEYDGWLRDGLTLDELRELARSGAIDLDEARLDRYLAGDHPRSRGARTNRENLAQQNDTFTFDLLLELITLAEIDLAPVDLGYIQARYDAETFGSDVWVGRVLALIEELGLTEDTMVVFTSDHGDELYDHNDYFFHSASIYEGCLRVPLVIAWPGRVEPRVVDDLVELVDLSLTMLDLANLPEWKGREGESFSSLLMGEDSYAKEFAVAEIFLKWREDPLDSIYSVRGQRWKLVLNRAGVHPRFPPFNAFDDSGFAIGIEELYDLERDPGERFNLIPLGESLAGLDGVGSALRQAEYLADAYLARRRLVQGFGEWFAARNPRDLGDQPELTEQALADLAALGYVDAEPLAPGATVEASAPARALALAARERAEAATQAGESAAMALVVMAQADAWLGEMDRARESAKQARASARDAERAEVERRLGEVGL